MEELARSVGASREEVAASMEAGARVGSIYEPFDAGDESGGCLADKIAEKTSENDRVLDRIVLAELLSGLGEKEQQIIKMRYFENHDPDRDRRAAWNLPGAGVAAGEEDLEGDEGETDFIKDENDSAHGYV